MPPKASTNNGKAAKTYSADVVAAVPMATGTTSLSMKHYEIMSSLDGVKTASAYQHDFRAVLAKAKELQARVDSGEVFEPIMMGKTVDSPAAGQKMIPADCVSVLLMALGNTTITREQLNIMSALDGTHTANSFEHQFRPIVAKAKELKKRVEDGEAFAAVQPAQKRGGTTPATLKKRKGDDADDTPTKKPKATPKPRTKKSQAEAPSTPPAAADDDVDLPDDMEDFIKSEKKWEEDQFV
ncbi:hypothetical protein N0V86_002242 [Didymella sp. IMI 355093]|nr:hypothetical protein N0V86_002242 [Didymella sp. IMI 355093]